MSFLRSFCLILIIIIAVIQDFHEYRVKNSTIVSGLLLGFIFVVLSSDINLGLFYLLGAFLPILLLFPFFIFRAFGAGDIKLFSVIGLFLGPNIIMKIILTSILYGGVQSILYLIKNKITVHTFLLKSNKIHFTLSILVSTIVYLYL